MVWKKILLYRLCFDFFAKAETLAKIPQMY